jgi:sporulation protein YlmC with PRC-barrel domain
MVNPLFSGNKRISLGGLVIVVLLVLLSELGNNPGSTTAAETDAQTADDDGTDNSDDDPLNDGPSELSDSFEVDEILGNSGVLNVEDGGEIRKGSLTDDDGVSLFSISRDVSRSSGSGGQRSEVKVEVFNFILTDSVVLNEIVSSEGKLVGTVNVDFDLELVSLNLTGTFSRFSGSSITDSLDVISIQSLDDFIIDSLGETVGLVVDVEQDLGSSKGISRLVLVEGNFLSSNSPVGISLDGEFLFNETTERTGGIDGIRENEVKGGGVDERDPEVLGLVDEVSGGLTIETETPDTFSTSEVVLVNVSSITGLGVIGGGISLELPRVIFTDEGGRDGSTNTNEIRNVEGSISTTSNNLTSIGKITFTVNFLSKTNITGSLLVSNNLLRGIKRDQEHMGFIISGLIVHIGKISVFVTSKDSEVSGRRGKGISNGSSEHRAGRD